MIFFSTGWQSCFKTFSCRDFVLKTVAKAILARQAESKFKEEIELKKILVYWGNLTLFVLSRGVLYPIYKPKSFF